MMKALLIAMVLGAALSAPADMVLTGATVAAIPPAADKAPAASAVTAPSAAVEEAAAVAAAPEAIKPPADTARLAEDQIPLTINAEKKAAEGGSSATKALMSGLIIAALLGASYYYVRKYKVSNTINKSNMQIKVLTQHYLGPKKSLAIVRVAGESILIGVTDSNISMIKSLSLLDDEIPADVPESFSDSLSEKSQGAAPAAASASGRSALSTRAGAGAALTDELDEEFSFAGVTDTVSKKIKSMRSFS